MKAVAYSIQACEKEPLVKANGKRHDITLISNRLDLKTASYAEGKEAVMVFSGDDLSAPVLKKLKQFGVKLLVARSIDTSYIDLPAAADLSIQVLSVENYSAESVAEQAVTLMLGLARNIVPAHRQMMYDDFSCEGLVGTTIQNKKVGIIGFGQTGQAVARIMSGFGADVLVHDTQDVNESCARLNARQVELSALLAESDIITLHVPLNDQTHHMINANTISKMKTGVMLINVSAGKVIDSFAVYQAVNSDKIGKLGMDVYEFENDVFYQTHNQPVNDKILKSFIQNSRVLLTPHQAFLTRESIQLIAEQSVKYLDTFESQKKSLVDKPVRTVA